MNSRGFFTYQGVTKNNKHDTVKEGKLIHQNLIFRLPEDRPIDQCIDLVLHNDETKSVNYKRLLHYNKDKIRNTTRNGLFNLFLPRNMGGIGCNERPHKSLFRYTPFQNLMYRKARKRMELGLEPKMIFNYRTKFKVDVKAIENCIQKRLISFENKQSYGKKTGLQKAKISSGNRTDYVLLPTYYCTQKSRLLAKDDWLANLSKVKMRGVAIMNPILNMNKFKKTFSIEDINRKSNRNVVIRDSTSLIKNYAKDTVRDRVPITRTEDMDNLIACMKLMEKLQGIFNYVSDSLFLNCVKFLHSLS
jgi:hypothetical protein